MLCCAEGGENGFNQAIELAADSLLNVKFIREKKLLSAYFGEIAKDSGRYWYTTTTSTTTQRKQTISLIRLTLVVPLTSLSSSCRTAPLSLCVCAVLRVVVCCCCCCC